MAGSLFGIYLNAAGAHSLLVVIPGRNEVASYDAQLRI
jgi:hypothetical protein